MKKILSVFLALLCAVSVFSLCSCNAKKAVKFGIASVVTPTEKSNAENSVGNCTYEITVAGVLLDKKGKILNCDIDTAFNELEFDNKGICVPCDEFLTKKELKEDYGLVSSAGSAYEWYEQIETFCGMICGYTIDELKEHFADKAPGTEELVSCGCTIQVSDFLKAVEKAADSAQDIKVDKDDFVKTGIYTKQTKCQNASENKNGENMAESNISVCVINKEKVVSAMICDVVNTSVSFDKNGNITSSATPKIKTARDEDGAEGENKNVFENGKMSTEWVKQAKIYSDYCVGKDIVGVTKICDAGYAVKGLKKEGCNMDITNITAAAQKCLK